jgi:hypothetical protein
VGQVEPAEVHRLSTQQPPELHALPAQQDWPAPPHGAQVPLLPHTRVPVLQVRLAQQASPLLPHERQRPPLHTAPAPVQVSPAQQASPRAPQVGAGASAAPSARASAAPSARASAVPPSSRVLVLVAVLVAVEVVVAVIVLVAVLVLVLVWVAVVPTSPADVSRASPPDGTSRTAASLAGTSRVPASPAGASWLPPEPPPPQPATSRAVAQVARAKRPMWTGPRKEASVRRWVMVSSLAVRGDGTAVAASTATKFDTAWASPWLSSRNP